ncbi:PEP/pyruvate-binding domain-containing protein [Kribbella sp. GL6]|uniref:PEP/pyruvate-binding domain-containing protein n=1 Tax=Kribbella sp. GL6 TaxID=3419765 RepID=UPI003D0389FD
MAAAGDPVVAVRSSASNEDTGQASAAGQYDTFLGIHGLDAIAAAVQACRASLRSDRATAYRKDAPPPAMAVIIQHHVDADISGVLFTSPDGSTLIESSWGLGPSIVEGRVTPDRYKVHNGTVTSTIADKPTALHRDGTRLVTRPVPTPQRRTPTLSNTTAQHLSTLATQAATAFGTPQDIEWSITTNTIWLLQSRPITTHPPTPTHNPTAPTPPARPASSTPPTRQAPSTPPVRFTETTNLAGASAASVSSTDSEPGSTLTGTPASHGTATGPARIVRGPADFASVCPGDILICPHTDPAWTPLLSIAAGVITETGGMLSHAAIVAREQGIPAVVAIPHATARIPTGSGVTLNGSTGAVHLSPASET